jgi:putative acetyltransferase
MSDDIRIRPSTSGDLGAIKAVYRDAFPDEDLSGLIEELLARPDGVVSLVGTVTGLLVAHAAFTMGSVDKGRSRVALLGPVAVASTWQRKGIGRQIIRSGLRELELGGSCHVFVFGDPAYYGAFGFSTERRVQPPFPLPAQWVDAWQSMRLGDAGELAGGTLCLPKPWLRRELWAP